MAINAASLINNTPQAKFTLVANTNSGLFIGLVAGQAADAIYLGMYMLCAILLWQSVPKPLAHTMSCQRRSKTNRFRWRAILTGVLTNIC
ncbi:MAG: hypothetical protein IPG70_05760 [Moraxellaceae bacterium]|nr:hypothetical protein [Moraxellaceae bacterium]